MSVIGFPFQAGSFTQEQETPLDILLFLQMALTESYLLILNIHQIWKLPKLLSIVVEWLIKSRYIHTMESHTAIRINDIQLHTTTSMTITNNAEERTNQRIYMILFT